MACNALVFSYTVMVECQEWIFMLTYTYWTVLGHGHPLTASISPVGVQHMELCVTRDSSIFLVVWVVLELSVTCGDFMWVSQLTVL